MSDDTLDSSVLFASLPPPNAVCWLNPSEVADSIRTRKSHIRAAAQFGSRPMHLVAVSRMLKAVKAFRALLDAEAKCLASEVQGALAVLWAVRWGQTRLAGTIGDDRINPSVTDRLYWGFGHVLAMGEAETGSSIENFVQDQFPEKVVDQDRIWAATEHWAEALSRRILRLLAVHLEYTARPDCDEFPPIFYAAVTGAHPAAAALVEHGVDPDTKTEDIAYVEMAPEVDRWASEIAGPGTAAESRPR